LQKNETPFVSYLNSIGKYSNIDPQTNIAEMYNIYEKIRNEELHVEEALKLKGNALEFDKNLRDLMYQCLSVDPKMRPTVEQIIEQLEEMKKKIFSRRF